MNNKKNMSLVFALGGIIWLAIGIVLKLYFSGTNMSFIVAAFCFAGMVILFFSKRFPVCEMVLGNVCLFLLFFGLYSEQISMKIMFLIGVILLVCLFVYDRTSK